MMEIKKQPPGRESFDSNIQPAPSQPQQEINQTLSAALLYLRKGFCPIPVASNKQPLITSWAEYQKRLPAEKEVRSWWSEHPNAGIALVCGHKGFAVLDIDVKGQPPQRQELANRIAQDMLDHATVVTTPSGGKHIYFFEIDGISKGGPLPGIGDLQAAGKYVLAPPSKGYRFENKVPPFPVPIARDFAVDFLQQYGIDLGKPAPSPVTTLADKIHEGSRNNTLTSIGGYLRSKGLNAEAIDAALHSINGKACDPPLPPHEVNTITKSLSRYPYNLTSNYKDLQWEVKLERINAGELKAQAQEQDEELPFLPLLGQDNFLVKGWSHIIAGAPKVGKTELLSTLCEEWGLAGESVLYFTEEPKSIWSARLRPRLKEWRSVNLVIALGAKADQILAEVRTAPESIVIIDTARNLLGLRDETDNSAVAQAFIPFIEAARQTNKTIIFSHHTRKGGGQHGEGIAGAHAFLGVVDIALEVHHAEKRQRKVLGWGRIVEVPELLYERQDDSTLKALGDPADVALVATKERLLEALTDEWQKTQEIRASLGDPTPSNEQVRQALESLTHEQLVERDPPITEGKKKGKTYRWRLPSNAPGTEQ